MSSYSVQGKSAIVTGAGSGINLAFASQLLSKGCNVLFADLALRPEAQKLVDEYPQKADGKARAVFLKTNVTEWKDLDRMFEVAVEEFGDLDIVCPGAGVFEPLWSNFWLPPGNKQSRDAPDSGRYATLDINVTHPIRTTQLAISQFLYPKKGTKVSKENPKRVVLISSIAGQLANLFTPMYFASKHAISGFIQSMASIEDTLGIRVNGVAPAVVLTPLFTDHPDKMRLLTGGVEQAVTKEEPIKKSLNAEEVAHYMMSCIEDAELKGGTVLEVGVDEGKVYGRSVAMLNDPGPPGLTNMDTPAFRVANSDIHDRLKEENWGRVTSS